MGARWDLPMPRRRRRNLSVGELLLFVLVFLVVAGGVSALLAALLAWLLQWVLHGFGVEASYWPCFGAVVLVSLLFGGSTKS